MEPQTYNRIFPSSIAYMRLCGYNQFNYIEAVPMVTLSDDEVALLRSLLIALRGIKVRDS
jgi:hypothetical protein